MAEVPVEWANDERSKINPLSDGIKMFGELLRVRWNAIRGRYSRPTFQFRSATPGTVLVESKRLA